MKKRLVTMLACMMLAAAVPMCVHAEEGKRIHGDSMQQNAAEMKYDVHYYESAVVDNAAYYYKFHTGNNDGVYLLSLATIVNSGTVKTNGTTTIQIKDQYGTVVEQVNGGGSGTAYRDTLNGRALDLVLPASGLEKDKNYYVCIVSNDGDSARQIDVTNKICVEFVPFIPAGDFKMTNNANGSMSFTWSNVQNANTYNSLSAYDGFQLELNVDKSTKIKSIGNGGTKSYTLNANDADLIALGYPANKIRIRLGSLQNYRSVFEDRVSVTKCVYSPTVYYTTVVPKNAQAKSEGFTYKITNVRGDGTGTATVTGLADKNACPKTLKIPDKVAINGISYLVTEIDKNAFKGANKLTTLYVGKNITRIRKAAFCNCKNLKTIRFNTTVLNTVGKDAFKNVRAKCAVYCPDSQHKTAYKKLLKKKITKGAKYKLS